MTNKYFNRYHFGLEQEMLQDLVTEAIEIYGIDVIYIPRNLTNFDQLYVADDQSTYTTPIRTTVYLQSVDGFGPSQNIFTKFGLVINDNITVSFSRRTYESEVEPVTKKPRPDEGDLIYFDLNKKVFQIKYTNNKEIFYELGKLPAYQMTCELFQYSDETFNTGIPEIDDIQKQGSLNLLDNSLTIGPNNEILTTEEGGPVTIEKFNIQNIIPTDGNDTLTKQANTIIDNSEANAWGFVDLSDLQ